jgi:hypothetical protein
MLSSCAAANPAFISVFYRSHIYLVFSFVLSPVSRDRIATILSNAGNDIFTLEPSAGQLFLFWILKQNCSEFWVTGGHGNFLDRSLPILSLPK